MVTLNIDGRVLEVEAGTTILEAATQDGIRIPTLCYDKRLPPHGGSFFCAVEVKSNGREMLLPACITRVDEGMEVRTDTPRVREVRKTQLMLILKSHPLSCPTCDAAGDCRLQQFVREYEIPDLMFPRETREYHVDNKSPFIRFDMNVCIKCGLCVRICSEVQGENALSFVNRGTSLDVSPDFGRPLDCEFCGQCAQICPVGAISSKWLAGAGRQFELEDTHTVCPFCSLGCTLTLRTKNRKIVYATSPDNAPNQGMLCVKGRYGWPHVYSDKRLQKPLIRKNGELQEVDWDEALDFVAEGFMRIKRTAGPTHLAALGSARLTNEEAWVFNRFVRTVIATPHLDHGAGITYRAAVHGLKEAFGYPASTNSIREIRNSQLIVLLGADLTETNPVAKNEVIIATHPQNKGRVMVVDSVRTKLCERPGTVLLTAPGTEHLVAYGMLREILASGHFPASALLNFEQPLDVLLASLNKYSPEIVAKLTGVNADAIRQAAVEYADASTATIVLTASLYQRGNDVALARAAAALALVTGRIGKRFCGLHLLPDKANSQGAVDMGLVPDLLPGFQHLGDPRARARFEAAWQAPLSQEAGLDACNIIKQALAGRIVGLYVVGENPVETYPDRNKVQHALMSLDFLVVQDPFFTATAKMAHAVLPAACFSEKFGTYTSAERRIQCLRPVSEPMCAKSDLDIFRTLAARMEKPFPHYAGPDQVMDEIAGAVEVYHGVSYKRLSTGGIQWPCAHVDDPGTEVLYATGFPTGKANILPPPHIDMPPPHNSSLCLLPRIAKFHSGSLSRQNASLLKITPEGSAELNPHDMQAKGLEDGDLIRLVSHTGRSAEIIVRSSFRAPRGSVVVPNHLSSLKLNAVFGWEHPQADVRVEKLFSDSQ